MQTRKLFTTALRVFSTKIVANALPDLRIPQTVSNTAQILQTTNEYNSCVLAGRMLLYQKTFVQNVETTEVVFIFGVL